MNYFESPKKLSRYWLPAISEMDLLHYFIFLFMFLTKRVNSICVWLTAACWKFQERVKSVASRACCKTHIEMNANERTSLVHPTPTPLQKCNTQHNVRDGKKSVNKSKICLDYFKNTCFVQVLLSFSSLNKTDQIYIYIQNNRQRMTKMDNYIYYICIYVCLSVWMYACMHVCMYACMHGWMYACMHVCMYGCMDVCMYAFTCMHMHAHACTCMHMHACTYKNP